MTKTDDTHDAKLTHFEESAAKARGRATRLVLSLSVLGPRTDSVNVSEAWTEVVVRHEHTAAIAAAIALDVELDVTAALLRACTPWTLPKPTSWLALHPSPDKHADTQSN